MLLIAVSLGLATGGSFSGFSRLRRRWTPLAMAGLVLQLVLPPDWWPLGFLYLSFVLLTVFCALNLRTPGFALILAGTLMNFMVIGVNQGMPVGHAALVDSGQRDTLRDLVENGGVKHHLAGPDDRLMFLADVLPIPSPIRQAVSAGDVVAYVGVGYLVIATMHSGRRRVVLAPPLVGQRAAGDG